MATSKNFEVKNGLSVGGTERISSAGVGTFTDLNVTGTTTTIDTATLQVQDKNIVINYGTGDTSSTASGAGITIQDAVDASNDATLLWDASADEFDFSHTVTAPSLKSTGAATFDSTLTSTGLLLSENTGLYTTNASISYYSATNGVYVNGAGNSGWLRLNASGTQNARNSIDLYGSSAGDYIKIKAANTDTMYIGANGAGRVGIGTSTPSTALQVGDGTGSPYITIDKSTTGASGILLKNAGNNKIKLLANALEEFELHVNNALAMYVKESGDVLIGNSSGSGILNVDNGTTDGGYVHFANNVGSSTLTNDKGLAFGWNKSNGGGESLIIGNQGAGSTGGLRFATNNSDGSAYAERMVIGNTGKTAWSANGIGNVTSVPRDFAFYTEGSTNGLEVRSNDERLVFLGAGGSSGTAVDSGYIAIANGGTTKIALNANGDSYIDGGEFGIGTGGTNDRLFHVKGTSTSTVAKFAHTGNVVYVELNADSQAGGDAGYLAYNNSKVLSLWTDDTQQMSINSSGDVHFNHLSNDFRLRGGVYGSFFDSNPNMNHNIRYHSSAGLYFNVGPSNSNFVFEQQGTARFTISSSGGTNGSDIKLKENVEDINYGLDTVKQLQPRKFDWKGEDIPADEKAGIGFIAQEVEAIIPEVVNENVHPDDPGDGSRNIKSLNYSAMTSVLVKAIQELEARVKELEG